MMNRSVKYFMFLCGALLFGRHGLAQSQFKTIPFDFKSEDDNRFIKEDDTFKYYVASWDTSNTVCIDEEGSTYRLYNDDHRKIAEGPFVVSGEKYLQDGRWAAWYGNGKVKLTGCYVKGVPAGTWERFYSSGKLLALYSFALFNDEKGGGASSCVSGTYQEYYGNGKLKFTGLYEAIISEGTDTIIVADPVDGHDVVKYLQHSELIPRKTGHWEYYKEDGTLEKKEDL